MNNYTVLARKYRPTSFEQVVGQAHVVEAIRNSIRNQKLHSVYLLSGTRGIGKTTIARIFAKAINCENFTDEPCGQCSSCQGFEDGSNPGLIEIDGASNNGVDEANNIIAETQHPPLGVDYSVFIIDEVHMLSYAAFNALLKTFEEPPAHVKFILCTTDPQKIPATVLSRCLHFTLKPFSEDQIVEQLTKILAAEGITYVGEPEATPADTEAKTEAQSEAKIAAEAETNPEAGNPPASAKTNLPIVSDYDPHDKERAIRAIARAGRGSMRDSLSLLDQALALANRKIDVNAIYQMLGMVDDRAPLNLVTAILRNDTLRIQQYFAQIAAQQNNWVAVFRQLSDFAYTYALVATVGEDFALDPDQKEIKRQIELYFTDLLKLTSDAHLIYDIFQDGMKKLADAVDPRQTAHLTILRAATFTATTLGSAS